MEVVGAVPFVARRPEEGVIVRPPATLVNAGSAISASPFHFRVHTVHLHQCLMDSKLSIVKYTHLLVMLILV